jgi:S-adenosylmethionine synthetase
MLGANDTSAAVGYAPLSETEQLVLEIEHYLNSPAFKARFPETGEDVKVMGVRTGGSLAVTIAMPILDEYAESEWDYFRRKEAVHEALLAHLTSAEDADSGEVGRGNQVNGLIALNRPRGSEAAAGKNPVSHVGKIYNVLTHLLAARIHKAVPGLREVVVWLCRCHARECR